MDPQLIAPALFAFLVFTEVRNYLERKSLLDRIMAKDYAEYAYFEKTKKRSKIDHTQDELTHIPV